MVTNDENFTSDICEKKLMKVKTMKLTLIVK